MNPSGPITPNKMRTGHVFTFCKQQSPYQYNSLPLTTAFDTSSHISNNVILTNFSSSRRSQTCLFQGSPRINLIALLLLVNNQAHCHDKNSLQHSSTLHAGLSMSKLDARCQSCARDRLRVLNIQFLELSLVLGCILFIKLERATNRARELSWARTCALVRVSLKGLYMVLL